LFTNASWDASTIPGASWDEMLGKGDSSGSERLHDFIRKYGRAALQAKWQKIWDAYKSRIYWDSTERCFKLKKGMILRQSESSSGIKIDVCSIWMPVRGARPRTS
jgi:hypothetical protein